MKIAFLTSEFPLATNGKSGGIGTSIYSLSKSLVNLGHEVRILVYGQINDAVFEKENLTIQEIKNVKIKGLSWYFTRKKIEKIINQLFDDNKIDIVEVPDWTGITSFIQPKKCPIVIKLHGSDTYFCHIDQRPVKWWNKYHEKRALKNAQGHISVSQYTANVTNKIFGLNIDFHIIHNGIDISLFHANHNSVNENVILYFGTLIRKKGMLELPFIFNNVISEIPNAKLILVGNDSFDILTQSKSTWELMQKLFSIEAIKNVEYKGVIPYAQIQKIIGDAKVCVFPTFAEALPVSWIEAMAMQKAVVASNIGWGPEVITEDKDGFLVYPKNHNIYAEKIITLLKDDAKRITFGKLANQKVQTKFEASIIAKQSIEFYSKFK